jgi:hypothetical protein
MRPKHLKQGALTPIDPAPATEESKAGRSVDPLPWAQPITPAQEIERDPSNDATFHPIEVRASGTTGDAIQFPFRNKKLASQLNSVNLEKSTTTKGKLEIKKSGDRGREVWTVNASGKTGRKGFRRAVFRIRKETTGYRVHFRYWNGNSYSEPYCCYLSAQEWRDGKKGTLADFISLMMFKLEQRKGGQRANGTKIDKLIHQISHWEERP